MNHPVAVDYEQTIRHLLRNCPDGFDLFIQAIQPIADIKSSFYIRCRINFEFLSLILHRQKICRDNPSENSRAIFPISCDIPSRNSMRRQLDINETQFFFRGNAEFLGVTSSQRITTEHLAKWLSGTPGCDTGVDQFLWIGGCLIYAENDARMLLDKVLLAFPEVAARQLAIEMAERISESEIVVSEPAGSAAPAEPTGRRRMVL